MDDRLVDSRWTWAPCPCCGADMTVDLDEEFELNDFDPTCGCYDYLCARQGSERYLDDLIDAAVAVLP